MSNTTYTVPGQTGNERRFIAIIGDIVASRKLPGPQRRAAQATLIDFLDSLNRGFPGAIAANFTIIRGDEFEALIEPPAAPHLIPDMIWEVMEKFPGILFRFGIGLGTIDTEIARDPRVVDGSAFHHARRAIQLAEEEDRRGGVFSGFGSDQDTILNGIARLLQHHRASWSKQQGRLAQLLRDDPMKSHAADRLGISRQAVSAYTRRAGWEAYVEGEAAWRKAIEAATRASFDRDV